MFIQGGGKDERLRILIVSGELPILMLGVDAPLREVLASISTNYLSGHL